MTRANLPYLALLIVLTIPHYISCIIMHACSYSIERQGRTRYVHLLSDIHEKTSDAEAHQESLARAAKSLTAFVLTESYTSHLLQHDNEQFLSNLHRIMNEKGIPAESIEFRDTAMISQNVHWFDIMSAFVNTRLEDILNAYNDQIDSVNNWKDSQEFMRVYRQKIAQISFNAHEFIKFLTDYKRYTAKDLKIWINWPVDIAKITHKLAQSIIPKNTQHYSHKVLKEIAKSAVNDKLEAFEYGLVLLNSQLLDLNILHKIYQYQADTNLKYPQTHLIICAGGLHNMQLFNHLETLGYKQCATSAKQLDIYKRPVLPINIETYFSRMKLAA